MKNNKPNILIIDIETAPILASVWSIWDQNIPLNMIEKDWHIISFSAKWLESEDKKIVYGPHRKIMYMDQRHEKNVENDKKLLKEIHKLLDSSDIVIGQNSKQFDIKKLNARFIMNGIKPPSPYKQIDTKQIASRVFGFTSNKLEYLSEKLCPDVKKSKHSKFPGFELWKQCLAGNIEAWDEMKKYNPQDVLSTEAVYHKFQPWDNKSPDFNLYIEEGEVIMCNCGSTNFQRRGFSFTTSGKYQRFMCSGCGSWSRGKKNMLTKNKREQLKGKA